MSPCISTSRFTAEDEAAWELAWPNAHTKLDDGFNTRRGELCAQHGPAIISAGDAQLTKLIKAKLDSRFFRLLIQTPPVKEWLSSNKSGADGRKEVKLEDFEELEIPLPEPSEQR